MRLGRLPTDPLKSIIEMNSISYSIDRPQGDADNTTYSSSTNLNKGAVTTDLDLFLPSERPEMVVEGEQMSGSLIGRCLPNADIEEDDRLSHGNGRYELSEKTGMPNDESPQAYALSFTRL